eukprot:TRINITY_DN10329_c0_g1_i3.p1 TRINITY_DN10329_c0_g1~~TRINITY_DN10329_c0_g1_i3.p1  ORF type:complete len:713 (+),score=222.01 TRINITY_DN10329_c0_g1_i3:247-2385(+)
MYSDPFGGGSPEKPHSATGSPVIIRPKGKSAEKKKIAERPLRGSLGRSPAQRSDRKEEETMLWHGVLDFDDYHNEKPEPFSKPTGTLRREVEDILSYITQYTPKGIQLETSLKPFVPDYIPMTNDVELVLQVTRPDRVRSHLGFRVVDEPSLEHLSHPAELGRAWRDTGKCLREKGAERRMIRERKLKNMELRDTDVDRLFLKSFFGKYDIDFGDEEEGSSEERGSWDHRERKLESRGEERSVSSQVESRLDASKPARGEFMPSLRADKPVLGTQPASPQYDAKSEAGTQTADDEIDNVISPEEWKEIERVTQEQLQEATERAANVYSKEEKTVHEVEAARGKVEEQAGREKAAVENVKKWKKMADKYRKEEDKMKMALEVSQSKADVALKYEQEVRRKAELARARAEREMRLAFKQKAKMAMIMEKEMEKWKGRLKAEQEARKESETEKEKLLKELRAIKDALTKGKKDEPSSFESGVFQKWGERVEQKLETTKEALVSEISARQRIEDRLQSLEGSRRVAERSATEAVLRSTDDGNGGMESEGGGRLADHRGGGDGDVEYDARHAHAHSGEQERVDSREEDEDQYEDRDDHRGPSPEDPSQIPYSDHSMSSRHQTGRTVSTGSTPYRSKRPPLERNSSLDIFEIEAQQESGGGAKYARDSGKKKPVWKPASFFPRKESKSPDLAVDFSGIRSHRYTCVVSCPILQFHFFI